VAEDPAAMATTRTRSSGLIVTAPVPLVAAPAGESTVRRSASGCDVRNR